MRGTAVNLPMEGGGEGGFHEDYLQRHAAGASNTEKETTHLERLMGRRPTRFCNFLRGSAISRGDS